MSSIANFFRTKLKGSWLSQIAEIRSLAFTGVLTAIVASTSAEAQTVRFETNVADFEIELNPTNNPDLTGHVDNFLNYVRSGVYNGSIINRSEGNFVLQMGNFTLSPPRASSLTSSGFTAIEIFNPVIIDADGDDKIDFDTTGLSNTRGEVSLSTISYRPNSGTNSFFINLTDNSFLDNSFPHVSYFIPFARIVDMQPIDIIANLETLDLSQVGGRPGSLAYTDVPVIDNDLLVVIENVLVVPEPPSIIFVLVGMIHALTKRRTVA